jgi:dTDP-4-amino-4,6-dideoxy-D-galactose acyltransferase
MNSNAAFPYYFPAPFGTLLDSPAQKAYFEKKLNSAQSFKHENTEFFFEKDLYDTGFYGFPVFKLLFSENPNRRALGEFIRFVHAQNPQSYLYFEIPSEDLLALRIFSCAGWSLTETRLFYFTQNLAPFEKNLFPFRFAAEKEVEILRKTAAENPNAYDRHHAEIYFRPKADLYLAEYAENALRGFCDWVLIPDIDETDSFMAVNSGYDAKTGIKSLRPVVSAVGKKNKGWHGKLLYSALHIGKKENCEVAYMNTQSTNRAVLRNFEKLSLRYGCTKHLFSCKVGNFIA